MTFSLVAVHIIRHPVHHTLPGFLQEESAMKIEQREWTQGHDCRLQFPGGGLGDSAQLVMVFGAREVLKQQDRIEEEQTMTFAGDVPEGTYARLMKANFDRLIDGAVEAARTSHQAIGSTTPDLAVLISCVGRKLVLKQRIEEEVEGVRNVLGDRTVLTGFYSYGEIAPFVPNARCELHNQTMTITTFAEI
jgi:hypothetical protein